MYNRLFLSLAVVMVVFASRWQSGEAVRKNSTITWKNKFASRRCDTFFHIRNVEGEEVKFQSKCRMLSFIFSTFSIAHLTISYNFSALAKSVSTISTAHKSNVITLGRGQQCFQRVLELILSSYRRWKMTTTGSSKTSVTESVVNWASVADRISSTSS